MKGSFATKITTAETSPHNYTHIHTHTHTESFPFTWALLTDLGLGPADNINGSGLTKVPLQ